MKNNINKKVKLGVASALLLSSVVPVITVSAEDDITKVSVKEKALVSAEVSNVEYTVIEGSQIFDLKEDKLYQYSFVVKDKEGSVVSDALNVLGELNDIHIKGLKVGSYDLEITVSEIPDSEGLTTSETTYTLEVEASEADMKIVNALNETVSIGSKEFIVKDAANGILVSKDKIDLTDYNSSGKSLESYVSSEFKFDETVTNTLSVQKVISKNGVREFTNVVLNDSDGTISVKVKPNTILEDVDGKFKFKENTVVSSSEPSLKLQKDIIMDSPIESLDLSTIITNERGDEFDYMLIDNDLARVNATINGKILNLESMSEGTQSLNIMVLKEDGNFVRFTLTINNGFSDFDVVPKEGVAKINYLNVSSNPILKEINSDIDNYTNIILYSDNKEILLRDNLIDFEIADISSGHFILGSYDRFGNLVNVYDLNYTKEEEAEIPVDDTPEVEIPDDEVPKDENDIKSPIWFGSVSDKEVGISESITINLKSLHDYGDVIYEVSTNKESISSYDVSEDGDLVITGLLEGEVEYSIKFKASDGNSDELKFTIKVEDTSESDGDEEELLTPVWTDTISNKEVSINDDVIIDLTTLHDSKEVVYEITTSQDGISSHKVLKDDKLVITGVGEGEVEYTIKMKNSAGESEDLKFTVKVEGESKILIPVWTDSISNKEVSVSKDITIDLSVLHTSKEIEYVVSTDKDTVSSHKLSDDGKLVITGVVEGEVEYSIKLKNSVGESEVLKFTVKVISEDEVLAPVWTGSISNKEVTVSKDITIDLKSLHDSKDVEYIVTSNKADIVRHQVTDGKLVITGIKEGEVEYSVKLKNSAGESKDLKFNVTSISEILLPVWTDTVSAKEVEPSKSITVDLSLLHSSKNVEYEVSTNKDGFSSHKITDGKLVITGVKEGEVEYFIKMKNSAGESKVLQFTVKVKSDVTVSDKTLSVGKGVIKTFNLSDIVENKYLSNSAYTYKVVNGGNVLSLNQGIVTLDNREGTNVKSSIEVYEGSTKVFTYNIIISTNTTDFGLLSATDTLTLNTLDSTTTVDLSKYITGLSASSEIILSSGVNSSTSKVKVIVKGNKLELTTTGYGSEVIKFKVKDGKNETKEFTLNVKVEQKVNTAEVIIKGNDPYFKAISSIFSLNSGEKIQNIIINYKDSSIVDLELVAGALRFTPKKSGETELEVIAVTDKGVEYLASIKVKVEYEEKKDENKPTTDKPTTDKDESSKLEFKLTSTSSKNTLSIDFVNYSLGQKLKEDFELRISNGKAYVGTTVLDVTIPEIKEDTYVFMKVNGELVSAPFYRNAKGELIIDINYEGDLVFSKELSNYGNIYGHYAETYIKDLSNKKILEQNWTSNDTFEINKDVKGNEFTNLLTRALGYSASDSKSVLVDNNIISNSTFEKINNNAGISREEAINVLYNAIKFKNSSILVSKTSTFVDFATVSDSYKESVSTLQSLGIIHGKPGLVFDPKANLTRAQVSKIVYLGLNHMR